MSKKLSLKLILRIIIPTLNSKSVLLLSLQTGFLLLRTYLSLVIARIDGLLVKHIVAKNKSSFFRILGVFFAISIPATYCNAMIKYLQSKIALQFRSLLTNHIHSLYLKNKNYYKAVNLDTRIGNTADQLITTDVKKFTEALSNLYSNLGKPVLDILIFNYQLGKSIGTRGMIGVGISYFSTALILRAATPKFGLMAAQEAMLEGDFRTAHARIITNAEEIAFYNGAEMEKNILQKTYTALIKHVNNVYKIRIAYNMFEDFLIKYTWSAVGLCLASIPVFFPQYAGKREQATGGGNVKSNAASFITNKRLMVGLADAGGRLMYSYKELVEMSGYASRVCSILNCLESLDQEQYVIGSSNGFDINNRKSKVEYGYPGLNI